MQPGYQHQSKLCGQGGHLFMSVVLNTLSQQPKLACLKPVTVFKILYPRPAYPKQGDKKITSHPRKETNFYRVHQYKLSREVINYNLSY